MDKIDINTLKFLKEQCNYYSDNSTQSILYKNISRLIDDNDEFEIDNPIRLSISELLIKFNNGEERYYKSVIFNNIINQIVRGNHNYIEIIDKLLEIIDKQSELNTEIVLKYEHKD